MSGKSILKNRSKISLFTLILFCFSLIPFQSLKVNAETTKTQRVKVRFSKEDKDYEGWNLWTWGTSGSDGEVNFNYEDEKGVYAVIEVPISGELGFIVRKGEWETKATGDVKYDLSKGEKELIVNSIKVDGNNPEYKLLEEDLYKDFEEINIKVNYNRKDSDYQGWNLWNWVDGGQGGSEESAGLLTENNDYGTISKLNFKNISKENKKVGIIFRRDGWNQKDGSDKFIDLAYLDCNGNLEVYYKNSDDNTYYVKPFIEEEVVVEEGLVNQPGGKNTWYIAGSFQGWNNTNPETKLKHLADGFFQYSAVLEPGTHDLK